MPEATASEPSMDEILASIRKIISEDDSGAPETSAAVKAQAPTDDRPAAGAAPPEVPEGGRPPAPPTKAAPPADADSLVGADTADATASSFANLKSAADDAARARQTMALPPPGRSLEDVTRELLRPLLKTWLDEHLPTIVQASVDEEVARIARGRVR
ncbi:MAG: DUF2497 domain-containing protein [Caulobacteraceae bacterium]